MQRPCPAAIARFLIPAFALCLLGPDLGRAQSNGTFRRRLAAAPVTIQVDGRELATPFARGTVADALAAAGVQLGEQDECVPALTDAAPPGTAVVVRRITLGTTTATERIAPRTRVLPTRRLRWGMTMIQQHPQAGLKELTCQVTYRDGEAVSQQIVSARVVRPAKDKILLVGGSESALPSRGGYFSGRRVLTMVASGYDPSPHSCGPRANGHTYLGWQARRGIVAVDPRVIPLGARLYVEGYGTAVAGDIGSAIKGNRIDLCFPTIREADRYGLKKVQVWILSD